jgi:hypothetical protein
LNSCDILDNFLDDFLLHDFTDFLSCLIEGFGDLLDIFLDDV